MLKNLNILLVDDDETIRSSMEYYLKKRTKSFVTAESAEDALAYLQAGNRPDIVISDYQLPGMNGLDFLKHIRKELPAAMTALITAHARIELAIEAVRLGVQDFIQKPFDGKTICNALEVLVKRSKEVSREPHIDGEKISEAKDDRWRRNADFIISKVCHQINNTLQSLQASAEIGLFSIGHDHPVSAKFDDILSNIGRVQQINQELRSFGNVVAEEPAVPVHINGLIDKCLRILRGNIIKEGISVDQRCEQTENVSIQAKAGVLLHILDNLAVNAIQAVAERDRVDKNLKVRTEVGDDVVRVHIADNGVGMDARTCKIARSKGFTTKPQGTGLGLFIVDRLCAEIGASLTLESGAGKGTLATLTIPR